MPYTTSRVVNAHLFDTTYLLYEDWLNVKKFLEITVQYIENAEYEYINAICWLTDTTYSHKVNWLIVSNQPSWNGLNVYKFRRLTDCNGQIHFVLNILCLRHNLSSKWRTGWLSRAYSSWSWHSCIFVFFNLLIDYCEALDTTYPPNGGLADCPKLIPSVYSIRCRHDNSEVLATTYLPNGRLADCPRLIRPLFT